MNSKNSIQKLAQLLGGDLITEQKELDRFGTDMSIYRIPPLAVVVPRDVDDIVATVRFAQEEGIPVTPRGGGSGTAGSALGRGIILSLARKGPMNRIGEFEEVDGGPQVMVEPAVRHDDLQAFLRERGLYLPADPTSGGISVLGGNVATKASGPHALKHGSIDRYLHHVQFVTVEGEVVDTADEGTIPTRIREEVLALRDDVLADDQTAQRLAERQDMKLASGYNLFTFLRHGSIGEFVAQLMVGSVGTLGVVTRATLRAEPYVEGHATMLLSFRNLHEAGDAVQHIKSLGVAAIEIMNHRSIAVVGERNPDLEVPSGEANMLLVEFEGPERFDQIAQIERFVQNQGYDLAGPPSVAEDEKEQARLWKVRKSLFPTLRNYRSNLRALSLVNDVGVGVEHLADLIIDLEALFDRYGLVAAIYGHAGSGNLHLRPLFDIEAENLPELLMSVADDVYDAVLGYDGTITAEHGMGRLRTPFLEREWGETIVGYMRRVKDAFDPEDLFNPDVIFSTRSLIDDLDLD
jgi:FAD/FMN-containing dehydrogenase